MSENRSGTRGGSRSGKARAKQANKRTASKTLKDRTDWARVDAMTDDDIAQQVANDPDVLPEVTDEMLERAVYRPAPKKVPISFRVDPDVLTYFKGKGEGYQSRMNAVLRAFMEHDRNSSSTRSKK